MASLGYFGYEEWVPGVTPAVGSRLCTPLLLNVTLTCARSSVEMWMLSYFFGVTTISLENETEKNVCRLISWPKHNTEGQKRGSFLVLLLLKFKDLSKAS